MRPCRRNITIINNEIDYDKLAEAIIRANENTENNNQKKSKVLVSAVAVFLSVLFGILCLAAFSFSIAFIHSYFHLINQTNNLIDWSTKTIIWLFIITIFIMGLIMGVSAIEIFREKDRHFIISVFSCAVGFIALVVALIALLKGVA